MFGSIKQGAGDGLADAFVHTALEFLGKLAAIYKQHEVLLRSKQQELAVLVGNGNTREILDQFRLATEPYAQAIANKDDKYILNEAQKMEFLKGFDIGSLWDKTPAQTKAAMWAYIGKLLTLALQHKESLELNLSPQNIFDAAVQEEKAFEAEHKRAPQTMQELQLVAHRVQERMKQSMKK